jgi:hypothetical protein
MASKLEHLIDALERRRNSLLDELAVLDANSLTAKPIPDKWSILEITEHLVVAEKVILKGLPPFSELIHQPARLDNRVKYFLVMAILRFSIPVKVPSRSMNPTGGPSLTELRQEWDRHLEWLRAYTKEFDDEGRQKSFFNHPVAGPITLVQALRMNLLHIRTHVRQIEKLKNHRVTLNA